MKFKIINQLMLTTFIFGITLLFPGCGGDNEGPISTAGDDTMEFYSVILGKDMSGPDRNFYEMTEETGLIYKKEYYQSPIAPIYSFPSRLTLPTRFIVPNGKINSCYNCHRLGYPVPSENPQVQIPLNLPLTEESESERGRLMRLTEDPGTDINALWSPNGSHITWVSDRTEGWQVWVMNNDGTEKQQITHGSSIHGWPEWSPDGLRLVYWEYNEQREVSAIRTSLFDGSDVITIAESGEALDRPVWSPDGKHIAYAAETEGNWDIWISLSDGKEHYRLTDDPEMETNPIWSPDGSKLAYKVAPTGSYNLTVEYFLSLENGFDSPKVYYWSGPQSIQMYDWSPDGSLITYTAEAVSHASGDYRVSYLAVVSSIGVKNPYFYESREPVILSGAKTLGDRGPVFSPDGKRIAFWAWDLSYRATLWIVNLEGTNLRQVTTAGYDMYPRWSPSGDKLLFESSRSGNMDIWTVTVD